MEFDNVVVTGCPSIYQNGKDYKINKKKNMSGYIKAVINGNSRTLMHPTIKRWFACYPQCVYVDQDEFVGILYDKGYFGQGVSTAAIINLIRENTFWGLKLVCEERLFLISEYHDWRLSFKKEEIDFSIGERIHGNIMAILGGIPAMQIFYDSRTWELSDYFSLPSISRKELRNQDLYDLCDYTEFNQTYEEKFRNLENFLMENGLIKNLDHVRPQTEEHYLNERFKNRINGQ